MAVEVSGIIALTFELDKDASALAETDEAMAPVQGASSVTKFTAIQDGAIRGIDLEIESQQSEGDDVIGSVYVAGSRVDGTEVTVAGAGTSAGADQATSRFDKDVAPVSEGIVSWSRLSPPMPPIVSPPASWPPSISNSANRKSSELKGTLYTGSP